MRNYIFILFLLLLPLISSAHKFDLAKSNKKEIDSNFFELNFSLLDEEKKYLKKNKNTITLCVQNDFFPVDDFVEDKHIGVMSDVFKLLSEKLNIKFEYIPSTSFKDMSQKVLAKECKMLTIINTKQKEMPNLYITKPIIDTYFTLISKLDQPFILNEHQLEDKKLVVQFQMYKNYLLKFIPTLNIEVQNDSSKMMNSLLNDDVFAVLTVDEKADYLIDEYGYSKLKINGFLLRDIGVQGGIGIQKDEQILISIIDKALDTISEKKLELIVERWRMNRYTEHIDYRMIYEILAIVFLILSIMYYYQRKLKKQVDYKTKELNKLNESLENTVSQKLEELREKDKMLAAQSKQAVMGEMISMIAHQWRQPLNTMSLQISKYEIDNMVNSNAEKALNTEDIFKKINETIMYLSETIDDFQKYFRLDKEPSETSINELFSKAVNLVKSKIISNEITIVVSRHKNIILNVYVNELFHVILNILNNAIDSYEGITKDEKNIKLYAVDSEKRVSIFIEDNGCGILDENLESLFEPYFSTKGKNGTGLGLYMSKMIIEKQFEGNIIVSSSSEGSLFKIDIPKYL